METNKIEQAAKLHADNGGYAYGNATVYEYGFINGVEWYRALNNYDALVEENKRLRENLARVIDRIEEGGFQINFPSAYNRAKNALNKYTEKEATKDE